MWRIFSVNLENNQIKFRIHFPKLVTRGLYSLDGRILMLPIVGNGVKEGNYSEFDLSRIDCWETEKTLFCDFWIILTIISTANVDGKVQILGSRVHNQGLTYYRVEDVKIDMDIEFASIYFSNLFNGDKQLGECTWTIFLKYLRLTKVCGIIWLMENNRAGLF